MSPERADFTAACEVSVPADAQAAWRAWADPELLEAWMSGVEPSAVEEAARDGSSTR